MNTLSKVLAVFCLLLSAVVFAAWESASSKSITFDMAIPDNLPIAGVATNASGDVVYVAKGHKLFKSTDGGVTWAILR